MGQEVKNLLRAQSKYGLMGSSAKTGKKIFCGSQEQFLDKTVIWDRTPQLYINCSVYVWKRAQGSQIFKRNSIISICSKIFGSLVICCPRGRALSPHHLCIISVSSPLSPKETTWSPWSPLSPCHPCIVPVVPIVSLG